MPKGRLEAFSDGVVAIIITIMVLEMHVPDGTDLAALRARIPDFFAYTLSYVFVGIYWSNHHHLVHLTKRVNGRILWANLHFLFWLSLVPFVTRWLGGHGGPWPTACYGTVLLLAALAYVLLELAIVAHHEPGTLVAPVGRARKEKMSVAAYVVAIPLAFEAPWLSDALYVAVAALWFVPDRRIEAMFADA
jgi:uncharacterized membrane protein